MPADGGGQDVGPGRHDRLPGVGVSLCDRTEQPPQPAGVIVNPDRADPRQSHRAGTDLTNPDTAAAALALVVAEPEAVMAASLALAPRKAHPLPLAAARPGLGIGGERPTEIDGGLLEHLGSDFMPPGKASHPLGAVAIGGDDEDTPGVLCLLPGIERVDQVEPRPRHDHRRVDFLRRERVENQSQRLVVGISRRSRVPGEHRRLGGGRVQRKAECGSPHDTCQRTEHV